MVSKRTSPSFERVLLQRPLAVAEVFGNAAHPDLFGTVRFYQTPYGAIVVAEFQGLPAPGGVCGGPIFGFHIHDGSGCTGNAADPFADAGMHWNPYACPHPRHAGDLPPLFGADGYAFSAFLTNRFRVEDVIGKLVIVHASADDFTTQPSGNSGAKIACGEIRSARQNLPQR